VAVVSIGEFRSAVPDPDEAIVDVQILRRHFVLRTEAEGNFRT
jgi:hypothetical protein